MLAHEGRNPGSLRIPFYKMAQRWAGSCKQDTFTKSRASATQSATEKYCGSITQVDNLVKHESLGASVRLAALQGR